MQKKITIAIDGPAASGKSTTARLLAKKLGYLYIDTGAMYRAATLGVIQNNVDVNDEKAVNHCVGQLKIDLRNAEDGQHTYLNGTNVTHLIRTPQINNVISVISSYAGVRKGMVEQQQHLASKGGVVMDGRDIGTVVLPEADLKVFLIASIDERAKRRREELQGQGNNIPLEAVKKELVNRDQIDSSRNASPLKKADDARELDTSNLTIDEQVEVIENWINEIVN
jgi:cytidylate kinase